MSRLGIFLLGLVLIVLIGMGVKPAMDGVYGFMISPTGGTTTWISPTGFGDPDSNWTNETRAYDNNITTWADYPSHPGQSWTSYINLTHSAIRCDEVRYYVNWFGTTNISIDVYYNTSWNNIYEGAITLYAWEEVALNNTQTVTAARVKFMQTITQPQRFQEFDFGVNTAALSLTENVVWRLMPYLIPTILIILLIAYLTGKIGGRQRSED